MNQRRVSVNVISRSAERFMKTLVISCDALNLAYAGCYGSEWSPTPHLDELAARSVLFDQHFSDNPDAVGAMRSLLSGRYSLPTEGPVEQSVTKELLSFLGEHEITTGFIGSSASPLLREEHDRWSFAEHCAHERGKQAFDERSAGLGNALKRFESTDHWLLWLELPTLAPPWKAPKAYLDAYFADEAEDAEESGAEDGAAEDENQPPLTPLLRPAVGLLEAGDDATFARLQRTYAAAVQRLDKFLGRILTALQEGGLEEEITLLFTAVRGLPLGEHGMVGVVRPWLHDELTHLPLILRLPGDAEAGSRVASLTQPVDLLPTLAELFGLPIPEVHGHSLMPLVRGDVDEVRAYACSGLRVESAIEWALRTPTWAYLLPVRPAEGDERRTPQLYVKPDDRWEVNNVIQHHPQLVEHLDQVLRGFVETASRPGPLHPPALRNLQALLQQQQQDANPPETAPADAARPGERHADRETRS